MGKKTSRSNLKFRFFFPMFTIQAVFFGMNVIVDLFRWFFGDYYFKSLVVKPGLFWMVAVALFFGICCLVFSEALRWGLFSSSGGNEPAEEGDETPDWMAREEGPKHELLSIVVNGLFVLLNLFLFFCFPVGG